MGKMQTAMCTHLCAVYTCTCTVYPRPRKDAGHLLLVAETRAAPALTVSASWPRKSHVARLQARPWQDRTGITAGSIPHWPLGPGAFGSTRHPVYPGFFNTEELEQKISKVAIPFVLPDCLPGTQVFRGKGNERPRRQGMCLVARSMGILALPLPGCKMSGGFLIKGLIFKRRC